MSWPPRRLRSLWLAAGTFLCLLTPPVAAMEVRVTAAALEQTLDAQIFNSGDGRRYLRGDRSSPCGVYAQHPRVSFRGNRVVIRVETHGKLGAILYGTCFGIPIDSTATLSIVPVAAGESIAFREVRLEQLSDSPELNALLLPFLQDQLPQQLQVNAAEMLRQVLRGSADRTGYALTLDSLEIHSIAVQTDVLVLDVDAVLRVD